MIAPRWWCWCCVSLRGVGCWVFFWTIGCRIIRLVRVWKLWRILGGGLGSLVDHFVGIPSRFVYVVDNLKLIIMIDRVRVHI